MFKNLSHHMHDKKVIFQSIVKQGILPLFYCHSGTVSLDVVRTLYRAGIRAIEYTNRGVAALDNFAHMKKTLKAEAPDLYLGIGTIKTESEAEAFIAAGADFIIAPVVNPAVAAVAKKAGLLWMPGCMTPTEIFQAQQLGAEVIKLFPANMLGPEFLRSIKALFIGQPFIPTGGVEIEEGNIREWYRAGVSAVGMGSKLITEEILTHGHYDVLFDNTVKAMGIVKKVINETRPIS
jgi:2-dehydro-3-deoxyphosphogluconate aldolase/(4S)-4-hydroxy-2-oxoglutarate aldolase